VEATISKEKSSFTSAIEGQQDFEFAVLKLQLQYRDITHQPLNLNAYD